MEIARATLDAPEVQRLIGRLDEELSATYPEEGATHFRLDAGELAPGRGAFLLAREDGVAVACGAIRRIGAGEAELKRMFTVPEARGRGWAARVLGELEAVARELGVRTVKLETGTRQGEAIRLYERAGYRRIEPWGEYLDSPLSICMAKTL